MLQAQKIEKKEETIELSDEPPGYAPVLQNITAVQLLEDEKLFPSQIKSTKPKKTSKPSMNIDYKRVGNYLSIKAFQGKKFTIQYPDYLFKKMDKATYQAIFDNYVYCATSSLRIFYKDLNYDFDKPYLKDFIDRTLVKDLPKLSRNMIRGYSELGKTIERSKINFLKNGTSSLETLDKNDFKEGAVLSLSFGKDSLLSYALLKELKIPVIPVNLDLGLPCDTHSRKSVIEKFSKNEKQPVVVVKDGTESIFSAQNVDTKYKYLSYTNGMMSMSLQLMPFSINHQYKYQVFGNERDLDGYWMYKNRRVYPSYDQSAVYMREQIREIKHFTNNSIQILSVIKPVYDLAIYKVLTSRYPRLVQYLFSCEDDPNKQWCENCYACAKNFLYLSVFTDPRSANLQKYMFDQSSENFYHLFDDNSVDENKMNIQDPEELESSYGKLITVRDQELLAFYLAYKKGYTGYLIDLFAKNYLREAQRREKELRKRYFGVYNHTIIPKDIKSKLIGIFREELDDLK